MAGDRNSEAVTGSDASAVAQDQAIFEKVFESLPDGIVETNARGRIVRVNTQAEKMLGYERGELAGQPINVLIPERYHEAHTGHTQHYAGEPRTRPMGAGLELYARRKDGGEVPVDIMLSPVEAPDGVHVLE